MRIKLLDVFKRSVEFDKTTGIIFNGIDNLYSEKIERITNNSVTAKSACSIMATYIVGGGFSDLDSTIVNSKNRTTLRKFGNSVSKNIAQHRGCYIHVMYNANLKIDRYTVLPYTHCRLGKKDDNKYNGKIVVYDNWDSSKSKKVDKSQFEILDVFNPNEDVLKAQIESAKGIQQYKGQVIFLNLDEDYDYPLGTIDTVINDADSERHASIFKNRSLRKGFFGKTLMVTKPLISNRELYKNDAEYHQAKSEAEDFKDTAESFLGAENSGSLLHVQLEHQEDKLDDAILIQSIPSDINDEMFKYTEESTFKNILMAFNNIPTGMVRSDNALFGNSGESLRVMKETYQENTTFERMELEMFLNYIFKFYKEDLGEIEITPLIEVKEIEIDEEVTD